MKASELLERLYTLEKGERIIEPFDKSVHHKISALNSRRKTRHFVCSIKLLICPDTAACERVCVITCIEPLPEA